jgi:prepilin-type N-terminal cleavage/methylation domain-containing protein
MRRRYYKAGFTLVELLVAMAIIAVIVSMVYGSYRATCESTCRHQSRIELCRKAEVALTGIARQIRCCWAPTPEDRLQPPAAIIANTTAHHEKTPPRKIPEYFSAGADPQGGRFLSMVTTAKAISEQDNPYGLFQVRYKFDKTTRTLYQSRSVFAGIIEDKPQNKNYQPVAEGVRSLELTVFDGRKWRNSFSYQKEKKLPCAVRIEITCGNKSNRLQTFAVTSVPTCTPTTGDTAQTVDLIWGER